MHDSSICCKRVTYIYIWDESVAQQSDSRKTLSTGGPLTTLWKKHASAFGVDKGALSARAHS